MCTVQYLSSPESQTFRADIIRFVICNIHPSNEILASDIITRWHFISWLLQNCNVCTSIYNTMHILMLCTHSPCVCLSACVRLSPKTQNTFDGVLCGRAECMCARARFACCALWLWLWSCERRGEERRGDRVVCASALCTCLFAARGPSGRPPPGSRTRGARAHVSAVKCVVVRCGAVWPASAIGFGPDRHGPARPAIRGFGSGRGPA